MCTYMDQGESTKRRKKNEEVKGVRRDWEGTYTVYISSELDVHWLHPFQRQLHKTEQSQQPATVTRKMFMQLQTFTL